MNLRLTSVNIVILADSFNPSIATKDWLRDHVTREEPVDFVNTPVVSVFKTNVFEILVDQSRFQLACIDIVDENLEKCIQFAQSYVTKLPHTPYKAVGFNFLWEMDGLDGLLERWFNCLPNLKSDLNDLVITPNIYARSNDSTVRISIEPHMGNKQGFIAKVNYHCDCSEPEQVIQTIAMLQNRVEDSRVILGRVVSGDVL